MLAGSTEAWLQVAPHTGVWYQQVPHLVAHHEAMARLAVLIVAAAVCSSLCGHAQDRRSTGEATYEPEGAPSCVWFSWTGGGGVCDAHFCDSYSSTYRSCTMEPVDATDEELEISDGCTRQFAEGENVFKEGAVCNENRIAMWPSSCQPASSSSYAYLADHARRGIQYCVGKSETECADAGPVPCGAPLNPLLHLTHAWTSRLRRVHRTCGCNVSDAHPGSFQAMLTSRSAMQWQRVLRTVAPC